MTAYQYKGNLVLLTRSSEYALLAIIILANTNTRHDANSLANKLNLRKPFLSKILQKLSKSNLLKSVRGVGGGFSLAKAADKISIYEIVLCVEDNTPAVCGIFNDTKKSTCYNNNLKLELNKLQNDINNYLLNTTIKELVETAKISNHSSDLQTYLNSVAS